MADGSVNLRILFLAIVTGVFALSSFAQRVSILPDPESDLSHRFAQNLAEKLNGREIRVDDLDLSQAAANSLKAGNRFNMEVSDARLLGRVLGNPFYVIVKAHNQRRTSSQIAVYFEGSASIYLVSSSTGHLLKWELISVKESTADKADQALIAAAKQAASAIARSLEARSSSAGSPPVRFQPVPEINVSGYEGLRPPMPYRRISPTYTPVANLYGVEATVEIEANIDSDGAVVSTEILRWAGYGLDESVEETVRKMNWRPATIGKRALPMRVLLRYNFKKIDDDEN